MAKDPQSKEPKKPARSRRASRPAARAVDSEPQGDTVVAKADHLERDPGNVIPAPQSDPVPDIALGPASRDEPEPYTVLARRYRPQRFGDVVGQDHVVRALRNAIRMNRVAQAYLFCGTRGIGKTSMARILAKCLNCAHGPTEEPCQACDICQAIAFGQDVDVIEIDGASNNGVDQVRELRQNAALRPSRSRFKIYYIDEVHMLTTAAFNALLKTLEEPPPHVKFLFATTEPNKIPITVLSRCQRYDFAGITPELIAAALSAICAREGVEAEPEALQVVARRAGGSLRDAQSLLDRLLASGTERLTVELVHSLLGTASDERLVAMLEAIADHDPALALRLLEQAASEGVQPADLLSGLIDFVRDAMVLAVGAESMLLAVTPRQRPQLERIVARWSTDSILAALQILGECRLRMRGSLHGQFLVEMALVRCAKLENLSALGPLIERLSALESGTPIARRPEPAVPRGKPGAPAANPERTVLASPSNDPPGPVSAAEVSKPPASGGVAPAQGAVGLADGAPEEQKPATSAAADASGGATGAAALKGPARDLPEPRPAPPSGPPRDDLPPLELATAREVWPNLIRKVGGGLGWRLSQVEPVAVEGPDLLVISSKPGYNSVADACGTPEALAKIEQGLNRLIHRAVKVRYERSSEVGDSALEARQAERRALAVNSDPMVQKVVELFEARTLQLEFGDPDSPGQK